MPLVFWLASATAAAATVYKWVDEAGVTHFSDQPHPNAKEVEVQGAQAVTGAPVPTSSSSNTPAPAARTYASCQLYQPENDEVFLNTSTVTAKLRLQPSLMPGDQVRLSLDGKPQQDQSADATEFVLTSVDRGSHSLTATVTNASGTPICTSTSVTFHVRQPSVQAPVKAVRPKF